MQKITPFLWFNDQAEEAVNFYISVFKNSRIKTASQLSDATPGPKNAKSLTFQLDGQDFMALDGGPGVFEFSGAISLFVNCQTQEEVDDIWEKFSTEGEPQQCGWIKDKYGIYWQIIPEVLGKMLNDPDPDKSRRVMEAMLKMVKIDIKELEAAYNQ